VHSVLHRGADVHGAIFVTLHQPEDALNQIIDVLQASGLGAVAIHGKRVSREGLGNEGGNHAAVVRPHLRAVGVEYVCYVRVQPVMTVVGHRDDLG